MQSNESSIVKFMEVTASNYEMASSYMNNAKFILDIALNAFYENYAPIANNNSQESTVMTVGSEDATQSRGTKRQSEEALLISSDEEDDCVFVDTNSRLPKKTRWDSCSSSSRSESPQKEIEYKRKILIDGSNVAVAFAKSLHGPDFSNKHKLDGFSVEGLETCIKYFTNLGFEAKAFVPEYRLKHDRSSNCRLIKKLMEDQLIVATPAKSYDDEILLESALRLNAAVVSNDFFRDFKGKGFDDVINKRIIRYNVVFNELILATDPYGRHGPKLKDILYSKK